ncbi:hypothetical protein OTK49_26590 [Vibrio coralliirubri]|uniref:hypothetical protein n=1 Tax=Vibrio coralliirubri TaxID=1516159 RepID=UPI002283487E|nr:hypothetical protein [Vibrio coralliirubri]MCY9866109.1 hypothetical protein [Vibrio coralliirubri]
MKATKYIAAAMLALFSSSAFANAAAVVASQQAQRKAEQDRVNSQVQTLPLKFDSFHEISKSAWTRHFYEIDGVEVTRIVVCEKGEYRTFRDNSKPVLERYKYTQRLCADKHGNIFKAYPIDNYMDKRFNGVVDVVGTSLYQGKLLVFYSINQ